MLFAKKIEPRCAYCLRGTSLNEEQVICRKKGVVSPGEHCRAFRYDPLRRVPPKPAVFEWEKLKDEDFSL